MQIGCHFLGLQQLPGIVSSIVAAYKSIHIGQPFPPLHNDPWKNSTGCFSLWLSFSSPPPLHLYILCSISVIWSSLLTSPEASPSSSASGSHVLPSPSLLDTIYTFLSLFHCIYSIYRVTIRMRRLEVRPGGRVGGHAPPLNCKDV